MERKCKSSVSRTQLVHLGLTFSTSLRAFIAPAGDRYLRTRSGSSSPLPPLTILVLVHHLYVPRHPVRLDTLVHSGQVWTGKSSECVGRRSGSVKMNSCGEVFYLRSRYLFHHCCDVLSRYPETLKFFYPSVTSAPHYTRLNVKNL